MIEFSDDAEMMPEPMPAPKDAPQYEPFVSVITAGVDVTFEATREPDRWTVYLIGGSGSDSVRASLSRAGAPPAPLLAPGDTLVLPGRQQWLTLTGITITGTVYVVAIASSNLDVGRVGGGTGPTGASGRSLVSVLRGNSTVDGWGGGAVLWDDPNGNLALPGIANQVYTGSGWDSMRAAGFVQTVAAVAITAGVPVTLRTPASGKKIRILGYHLSLTVAGSVILKEAGAEVLRTPLMAAGVGQTSPPMGNGVRWATANNVLQLDVTANGSVSGIVLGTEE
jgi:hypothetical protein